MLNHLFELCLQALYLMPGYSDNLMKQQYDTLQSTAKKKWPRWVRISLRGFLILILLQIVFCLSVVWYVNSHKTEVLQMVTEKLNANLNGKLTIESMEPTFLKSFPRISLHLKNVTIRDARYEKHNKTLLQAGDFDVALNAIAFIRGSVEINKITIGNAAVNLYTDASGYTNSSVFKSNAEKGNDSPVYPELKKFELDKVNFTIDNQNKHKLFQFEVDEINGKMESDTEGWKASFDLKALVKSLAFSTRKGSFIKDKVVEGHFDVESNTAQKNIVISENKLDIGGEYFKLSAEFSDTKDNTTDYAIHIVNDRILWRNASHLLTPNIYSRLDMFNLKETIAVRCDISGNFDVEGDPFILVNAKIKNNQLDSPGGIVTNCSFTGIFTNNHIAGKGFNDQNSAVKFENFNGSYSGMQFTMNHAAILNLENPIATGDLKSKFDLKNLGNVIDPGLLTFTKGTSNVNLNFTGDIVNYKIAKPIVTGTIAINDGTIEYAPRKLHFTKTSILLDFRNNDLFISNINLESGRSVIKMEGEVRNFLNLYYTAPEKVVLNWRINSPEIHLAEFLRFLGSRTVVKSTLPKKKNADFTKDINHLFEKSQVSISLRVKKLFYNKFLATNVKADVLLRDSGISVRNGKLNNSGGFISFNAALSQSGKSNRYKINADVNHVDVSHFFYAFDNFGLQSMNSKNLRGMLSATSEISGAISNDGTLVPKSILGNVAFQLNKGELLNFDPIRKIGKYAFPLRDMNNIVFHDLKGKFSISGEKVLISPMQINSSILNMDVDGLYSFGKGTNISVSVPLRNPEKDKDITDATELAKRRERGIVVRLQAIDGEDGNVKIKLVSRKTQQESRKGNTDN